jgi:hypothetical protein
VWCAPSRQLDGRLEQSTRFWEIRVMKKAVLTMTAVAAAVGLMLIAGSPADARPKYKMVWDGENLKEGSAMHKALEGKSNCFVCHAAGTDRKKRNPYGMAIAKALGEDKNVMDETKIKDAFAKAAKEKPEKSDKTFGDMIKEGTWKPTMTE